MPSRAGYAGVVADLLIRPARSEEAETLSALAFRSKAYWGYDRDFMEQCRSALTYTGDQCLGHMYVAEHDGRVVGLGQLVGPPPTGVLADLFVDPTEIGHGIGSALLHHITAQARDLGFRELELDSEPHARGFYARHGATFVCDVPSDAIPGRTLPRMRLPL